MQSVMTHSFSRTPQIDAPRSRFNRSHGHKFTIEEAGWLIPFYWDDVLPGDTFNLRTSCFARLATPLFPIMDNMYLDTHFFFVPYRLIWDNSKKFFGEQVDPGDSIDYTIPKLEGAVTADPTGNLATTAGRTAQLMDYIGVPIGIDPDTVNISALPFRAYSRIYAEWFRDQNLIDSPNLITDDGPDDMDSASEVVRLEKRGKRHDYFTSALPWPQKGDAVSLPLGTTAPVTGIGFTNLSSAPTTTPQSVFETGQDTANQTYNNYYDVQTAANNKVLMEADGSDTTPTPLIHADLTNATAATINDIREAFQVQKLLERDARGGTRYSEIIKNHFNVDFYDVSYRPEYLGGGSAPINVSPVAKTALNTIEAGGPTAAVGDLGAMGTVGFSDHGFSKSFVEHGIVMGIMSIRADLTYQQGLRREFSKSTRYDIYWPSLAHLGEQEILNKEIYCDGSANDDLVFGYQERYAEYRYKQSQISGLFRSNATGTLDPWHLSQDFASLPTLGQTFIEETPPLDRVVAVSNEPHFIVDTYINLLCARPMPVFGVPGMVDHF